MRDLLFLAHRIPYPPDKGDKIRSFHLLEGLSRYYRIHLGSFIDDPADAQHAKRLGEYCASLYLPRLRPFMGQVRGAPAALRGAPLSLSRYVHAGFARWVGRTLRENDIAHVFAFSSAMGDYGLTAAPRPLRRVMDFVDVDSEKWRQYAEHAKGPMRAVYAREHRTLAAEEKRLAAAYDAGVFVSAEEAELFTRRNPAMAGRVHAVGNGVDAGYFDPALDHPRPFPADVRAVVFTGAMDYQANIEGVEWFCRQVWPKIKVAQPEARFYIVGQRPSGAVQALAREDGVEVTGRVPDVRPYLAHADVVCAPLRVARGVQNKVIEALAMGRPVVGTHAAWEGIGAFSGEFGARVDDPEPFAREVTERLCNHDGHDAERRRLITERFSWARTVEHFLSLLEEPMTATTSQQRVCAS